jgi:hypothetical protein
MADRDPIVKGPDPSPALPADWPARVTATVVRYVGTVRAKTTGPALAAARWVVYLAAISLIAMVVAILGLVLVVRVLVTATGYVPGVEPGETWLAYLILGGIFMLAGVFLWRKKER